MRVLLAAALALTSADAATRVAVIELGKSGTVRRTTSTGSETSAAGVASFWSALHGYGRKLQHAGMPVVPDLFSRPESGVVVGLTGVDLDTMPYVNGLMTHEDENGVVGHMEVPGHQSSALLKNVDDVEDVDSSTLLNTAKKQYHEAGISGIKTQVTSENASEIDAQLAALVSDSVDSEKTVILHLVVEEDDGAARRRQLARRLEGEGEGEGEGGSGDHESGDGEDNGQYSGYYGYGYYNAYGEWVTPYKTMFQIQYFNVVLWTSVGLVGIMAFSLYLMIYMPLMADTLLFGESAKIAGDD